MVVLHFVNAIGVYFSTRHRHTHSFLVSYSQPYIRLVNHISALTG